jgi:hypothetical protein
MGSESLGHELQISPDGALALSDGNGMGKTYALSDLAAGQMCQKLEIPVKYYRRLANDMKATVANYDIGRLNWRSYLLRAKGDWIRAFLSSEYVVYNNAEIAETVEKLLTKAGVSVKGFILEESAMLVKIISEEIWDMESGLKAGILIGNSEVGLVGVLVEPFVFRQPCTNDLIVSQEKSFHHAHIHLTEYEMTRRMAQAVSEGFRLANSLLEALLKTRQEPIDNPVETIRRIAEIRKLSQKFTDEAVSSYLIEPEPNRFAVINAFTNAAQKLGPLQRIEMERFAGTLLEAPL